MRTKAVSLSDTSNETDASANQTADISANSFEQASRLSKPSFIKSVTRTSITETSIIDTEKTDADATDTANTLTDDINADATKNAETADAETIEKEHDRATSKK